MLAAAAPRATGETLSHWLRLLWDIGPSLHFDSESPFMAGGAIHLPRCQDWRHNAAAAAHAAAHLVYSAPRFDPTGLAPIARSLVALFEDARVEALAMRELPGLARLWRPWHDATPALGGGFEALMARLARALIDPRYDDPDPWVRKGRVLFYLDAPLGLLALRTPAEVRHAATLLGHDIGQMRLQFNAKTYRPLPGYRDDHRWMWPADAVAEVAPPPSVGEGGGESTGDEAGASEARYPEWDRLIARVRPDWTRVIELKDLGEPPVRAVSDAGPQPGLRAALRALLRTPAAARLRDEGDLVDLAALIDWRTATGARRRADASIFRAAERAGRRGAALLLIDQSASTASSDGASGASILDTAVRSAAALAGAFQSLGIPCAVAGFASRGRHRVEMRVVQSFEAVAEPTLRSRLAALRSSGSTRLGAALRHGVACLASTRRGPLWLLVLSDGEAHDIDIHDPRYLAEDARQAIREAGRRGVWVRCLLIGQESDPDPIRQVFDQRGAIRLVDPARLARSLRRLVAS